MAEGNTNSHEMSSETFHEIETECSDAAPGIIALLLKIMQPGGRPLPVGVVTKRSIMALLTDATNYEPLGVTIMNNIDVVAEFGKGVRVFKIAQLLHSIDTWNVRLYICGSGCIVVDKQRWCALGTAKTVARVP